jgi:aminopeptidase
MTTFDEKLNRYAELAVKVGLNIQPKQTLVITAPLSSAEFVRKIAVKAYEAGAKNVHTEWTDDELTRIKYDMAPDEAFSEYPAWRAKGFEEMAENGAAFLSVVASNPDLLKGIHPDRISAATKAAGKALRKYRSYAMADKMSWSVIAVPSPAWAAKVFPEMNEQQAMEALWNCIFQATRTDQDNPVAAWREHTANLEQKAAYLNQKKYRYLHYKAVDTDLSIELPSNHVWVSGGSVNEKGTPFVANMPTEEVFTAPLREGVNGVVRSTKPLSYGGNLIENFTLTFDKGRITDFSAASGYETLKRLIETDEGSHYLGEIALVPYHSPISNTNIIFFNTLFDENASSHLAIGNGYAFCLEDGKKMTPEELEASGLNSSLTHVDFMIGSADMNIDGETAEGKREPLFRNGNWAF